MPSPTQYVWAQTIQKPHSHIVPPCSRPREGTQNGPLTVSVTLSTNHPVTHFFRPILRAHHASYRHDWVRQVRWCRLCFTSLNGHFRSKGIIKVLDCIFLVAARCGWTSGCSYIRGQIIECRLLDQVTRQISPLKPAQFWCDQRGGVN